MRNIRVAVLDTGIANEVLDERIKYKTQLYYDYYEEKIMINEKAVDYNGHGTMCVETMWNRFPNIDIYVIKVLNISGITNSIVFKEALKFVEKLEVDIVSICASYIVSDIDTDVEMLCENIIDSGKIIIASVQNGKVSSAIANYKSVIGVIGGIMNEDEFYYSEMSDIQMQCSGGAFIVRGVRGMRDTFQGNSRATAIATGILAEILFENKGKVKNITLMLQEKAASNKFRNISKGLYFENIIYKKFDKKKELFYIENDKMYQQLIYLLCEFYVCESSEEIRKANLIKYNNGFLFRHLEDILQLIEERFEVSLMNIDIKQIQWAYLFYEKYLIEKGDTYAVE